MKIKQTIKKIEEEIERLKRNLEIKRESGTPTAQFDFNIRVVEGKLSGYKLGLKDVLSEIDESLIKKSGDIKEILREKEGNVGEMEFRHTEWINKEELKKPIQEVLK